MVVFYFRYFVFSLAIDFYRWYIAMITVSQPTAKQLYMKHIMNTSQRSTARQIQMISHIANTINNNEFYHKMIMKFPCPMQAKVLCQQKNLIANCIFNMPAMSISILFLKCLRLQQAMLQQLT